MKHHLQRVVRVLLYAVLFTAGTTHASTDALYYIRHSIQEAAAPEASRDHAGFHTVQVQQGPKGERSVVVQPLWLREPDAEGRAIDSSLLDPDDAGDGLVIALLRGGFVSTVNASGVAAPLQARDAAAAKALRRHDRARFEQQLLLAQAPGLRPVSLPESVAPGQQFPLPMRIEPLGNFVAQAQVLELTAEVALLSLQVQDKNGQGTGRVAVRRADGMPIELRLQVEHAAGGALPATQHHVHAADMAYEPRLELAEDLANYQDYVAQVEESLARAPFDGTVDEVGLYSLSEVPVGALQPHMVAAEALPDLERGLAFGWLPIEGTGASRLLLGARARLSKAPVDDGLLVTRLQHVQALDAAGEPIESLQPQVVTRNLYMASRFNASEEALEFPFRLPLGTPQAERERIHTLRLPVAVDLYQWHSVETIALDAQSAVNASLQLAVDSPLRVSVIHDRAAQRQAKGLWTVVVPLDAEGNEIPSSQMSLAPLKMGHARTLAEVPLAWESRDMPLRLEIAAARPISQLQLRHYQWALEPRIWDFRLMR